MISPRTRQLLATAHIDGLALRLAEQVTPAEYAPIRLIVEALGGRWSRTAEAIMFPAGTDVTAVVAATVRVGRMPVHPRTADGFVATPAELAESLCGFPYTDLAYLPAGSRLLEPSAGDGALIAAAYDANPDLRVTAVEPDRGRAAQLAARFGQVNVVRERFEDFTAHATAAGEVFDAVVMNPPFATTGQPSLWITHVQLAFSLLAPGARLVAVVPRAVGYRTDRRHAGIRALAAEHGGWEPLPDRAFRASGTDIAAAVLWLTRPMPGVTDRWDPETTAPGEPVRVRQPLLTASGAATAPVQVWWDSWRHRDRLLYLRGRCTVCGWLLWGFADGENDPRGVLGEFSAGFSLDAADCDKSGPTVGLCPSCGSDHARYDTGLAHAGTYWADSPAPTAAPTLSSTAGDGEDRRQAGKGGAS